MKTIILFFSLCWAFCLDIYAQNDLCSNTPTIDFTTINQSVLSTNLLSATVNGEFLPFAGLIKNQPIVKSIYFKINLPYARKINFEVKPSNANSLKTDHVGFAIYQANDCNLSVNNLIYSNVGVGSYESSNSLAAGTYYVQIFCNQQFDSEVVLNLKKFVNANQNNNPINLALNDYFCIETDNLAEVSYPNYPNYSKSFWTNIEIPVGYYAMLRFRAWNMNTVAKLILRKNNSTTPVAVLDLPPNAVFQNGICGLDSGKYNVEILLKPEDNGYFCLQNSVSLKNNDLLEGTDFSNAINFANNDSKTINLDCNPISTASCENDYKKHSFTKITIPASGNLSYENLPIQAKFQLFDASQTAFATCQTINNSSIKFCGLSAGTYYAKLSFLTSTQLYNMKVSYESEVYGDKQNNPLIFPYLETAFSVATKCLTLDSAENTFSSAYSKSFWAKINIPTAHYGNPIDIKITPSNGNYATNGKIALRMFKDGLIVQNTQHLDLVTASNGSVSSKFCSLVAGDYWVQVLLENLADYTINCEMKGKISNTIFNKYTFGNPQDFEIADNKSLNFEDYLACIPIQNGYMECAKPKCSTFLKWTIASTQTLNITLNPVSNPDSLKFIIWKKGVSPCQYISFTSSCGNSTAVLSAGTYMMQVYKEEALENPLLAMLTVTLQSPQTTAVATVLNFVTVNINDSNKNIGNLVFGTNSGLPDDSNPTPGGFSVCNPSSVCQQKTSFLGFDLQSESFVKLIYNPNFKIKLYKAHNLSELTEANLVYACGDSSYFCSLQTGKYILALFSSFENITQTVRISAWENCSSKAPSLALASQNNFGVNPQNVSLNDKICCTTQRNENDNLPTTNNSRHVWFTWRTTQLGNFTIKGNYEYGDNGVRFYLYSDDSSNEFVTTNLLYHGEFNINYHTFSAPCNSRRYYLKMIGKPNQNVFLTANFTPNANTMQGNYMSNAYALNFQTAGNYAITSQEIACHDLSPSDYRENDNTDIFTNNLPAFKSTWFKIHNQSENNINMQIRLIPNLYYHFVRYRVLKANATGTNVISEGANVTNASSIINLECFNDSYYYIQVLTNQSASGTLTLQANVNNNTGVCPPKGLCAISGNTSWTGTKNEDWFDYENWTAGVPDINTDAYISNTISGTNPTPIGNIPFISANKTAFVANIFVQKGLDLQGTLKLNHHFVNQSTQNNFSGKVIFVGCQTQFISGDAATFENIEVDNLQNLEIKTSVNFSKTLVLTNGNVLANGLLNLLSNTTQTAMIIQKDDASNKVIGNMNVQRHLGGNYQGISYKLVGSAVKNANLQNVFAQKMNLIVNSNYNQGNSPYTTPFPTIYYYDESQAGFSQNGVHSFTMGWKSPNHVFENMMPLKGYMANIYTHKILDFIGEPNNGSLEINISNGQTGLSRGWNFVANPYPSPIFWDKVLALSQNVASTIYMQIAKDQYESNWGYYDPNTLSGTYGVGNEIALGQGFFVYCEQNTGKIVMNNSVRLKDYKNVGNTFRKENHFALKLSLSNNYLFDETTVVFGKSSDIRKLKNSVLMPFTETKIPFKENFLNIYTQKTDQELAVQTVENLENNFEIPLKIEALQEGNYELKVAEIDIPNGFVAYLFDPSTKENTLLDTQSSLNISLQSNQNKNFVIRFFRNENPFPTQNELVIYPNPVENELKMQWINDYEGQADFKIFDLSGKELANWQQKTIKNQVFTLPIQDLNLPSGIYHLQIKTEKDVFVKKFAKK